MIFPPPDILEKLVYALMAALFGACCVLLVLYHVFELFGSPVL